jgi:hypothetical protein
VHQLTGTTGIVALAAAALAILALLACLVLSLRLRRWRRDQIELLGDRPEDLVAHAAALQRAFSELHEDVEDFAAQLSRRMESAEGQLQRTVAHRGLVHYDAYGEMSGRQSTSIALLDSTRSGIVLSSIHHRDQARIYAKQIHEGRSEIQLSPEEDEAVRQALADGAAPRPTGTAAGDGTRDGDGD